jgi:hypothetical protein
MKYDFYKDGDRYRVTNAANGIGFYIHEKGYTVYALQQINRKEKWQVNMILSGIGRYRQLISFVPGGDIVKQESGLLQKFGFVDVEYINNMQGLRQNFIINKKLPGEGNLSLNIKLESVLGRKVTDNKRLLFYTAARENEIKLIYEDLNVWDARHNKLDAYMSLNDDGCALSIIVDDRRAIYPVTIDPLNKTPERESSANRILPGFMR